MCVCSQDGMTHGTLVYQGATSGKDIMQTRAK